MKKKGKKPSNRPDKRKGRVRVKASRSKVKQRRSTASSQKSDTSQPMELELTELQSIVERTKRQALGAEDYEKLEAAVDTLAFLTQELEAKGASIRRLRKLIFGSSSEKTSTVLDGKDSPHSAETQPKDSAEEEPEGGGAKDGDVDSSDASPAQDESSDRGEDEQEQKKKAKGHGRNGASKYTGAEKVGVSHEKLKHGDRCPGCERGKVYRMSRAKVLQCASVGWRRLQESCTSWSVFVAISCVRRDIYSKGAGRSWGDEV